MIINSTKPYVENETDVYVTQTFGCTNPKCEMFVGEDLTNPEHTITTKKIRIN